MAAKAIRVGEAASPNETFTAADFELKHNEAEIAVDTNFAAQSFWKDALIRFFHKKSAVLGLVLIVFIVLLAVFAASLETVVRLTTAPSEGMACVDADYRAACAASEIRRGALAEGTTELSYGWGTLTVRIEPYAPCPALWQATLTVKIANGRKKMEYRYLVDPDGFDRNTIIDNE